MHYFGADSASLLKKDFIDRVIFLATKC